MLGAIIGDTAGSHYEFHNIKTKDFQMLDEKCHLTDDSYMSIAIAKAILCEKDNLTQFRKECICWMQAIGKKYPHAGYGGNFRFWLNEEDPQPYYSFGNGSAMRVSACGWAARSMEESLALAKASAEVSHNHPEGIKGAQAVAAAIYLAKTGSSKEEIRKYILDNFYEISFTLDEIRPTYHFDVSCQGSVPQALQCFFESKDFEDTIRNAVSIGGDCDTTAAIAGSIAEAYYGIPQNLKDAIIPFIPAEMLNIIEEFEKKYQQETQK